MLIRWFYNNNIANYANRTILYSKYIQVFDFWQPLQLAPEVTYKAQWTGVRNGFIISKTEKIQLDSFGDLINPGASDVKVDESLLDESLS